MTAGLSQSVGKTDTSNDAMQTVSKTHLAFSQTAQISILKSHASILQALNRKHFNASEDLLSNFSCDKAVQQLLIAAFKKNPEEDKEEQEATASLAAAIEISVDAAAILTILSEPDSILAPKQD